MTEPTPFLVISDAHEWAQQLPLSDHRLVCMRCSAEVPIRELGAEPRCKPHCEAAGSGWTGMIIYRHPDGSVGPIEGTKA